MKIGDTVNVRMRPTAMPAPMGGHLVGTVVGFVEDWSHNIPEAWEQGGATGRLAELTIRVSADAAELWDYRIPATAIAWVSYRASLAGLGPGTNIQDCTCVYDCAENPATACSLSGSWHVHPDNGTGVFGACPVHPDAPGDL